MEHPAGRAQPAVAVRPYADADHKAVRALFIRVNRELATPRLRAAFERYIRRALREEIDRIPAYYRERDGGFWVAAGGSGIVGMFGLERSPSRTGAPAVELRRMYVEREARHRGMGRWLLAEAEATAFARGCRVVALSTSELQQPALRLYLRAGYRLVREEVVSEGTSKVVGAGLRRFHLEKPLR